MKTFESTTRSGARGNRIEPSRNRQEQDRCRDAKTERCEDGIRNKKHEMMRIDGACAEQFKRTRWLADKERDGWRQTALQSRLHLRLRPANGMAAGAVSW